eukprot:TRINITY_DN23339_c0_g1_i1.p1 TRINITY_DN23339_c0_g1~~TRINITY_DN23339_c0_g1_i1.p1  ORF type:complete len:205 (-),score=35.26 TRINITY_DN23339_c0_g1_i1:263-877(-)
MAHCYGDRSYWENRYSRNKAPFEWLQSHETLAEHINDELGNVSGQVLVMGTGTSSLAKDMVASGYSDVCGVDWCQSLITMLSAPPGGLPEGLSYKCCAAHDLAAEFGADSVDYVVDKAMLDALMCGNGSTRKCYEYMKSLKEILKPGGKALIVSYAPPSELEPHLSRSDFNFQVTSSKILRPTVAGIAHKPEQDPNHYIYLLVN